MKEVFLAPVNFETSLYHNIALEYILKNDRNLKNKEVNISKYMKFGNYSEFTSVLSLDHFCIANRRKKFNSPCYIQRGEFVNIPKTNNKNKFTLFFSPVFLEKELFVTYSLCSPPCDFNSVPCMSKKDKCFDWVTYYFVFEDNKIKNVYITYPNRNQDDDFHNYIYDDLTGEKYDMYGNKWDMFGNKIK